MKRFLAVGLLALISSGSLARAQGVQTGTITGTVQSADGLPLPGVTVTVASPALLGQRVGVTDVNGVYIVKGLPAGIYAVGFDIAAFQPSKRENVPVNVGATMEVSTTLALAGRTESVTVTAAAPSPVATVAVSQAYTKRDVDLLPVGRRTSRSSPQVSRTSRRTRAR
jgi:hypothetical protein